MRRLLIILGLAITATLANAQTCKSFIDQVYTEKTGIKGKVTFDGGTLKMCNFEDTAPNLKKGTEIELLSPKMIKDNTSWNLSHIKIKVIVDKGTGAMNGKIGYMYPASTSFSSYADYTTEKILVKKIKEDEDMPPIMDIALDSPIASADFLDQLPTEHTGVKGIVTFDGGTLKTASFNDVSPSLEKGTRLELISPRMLKDNTYIALHHVKVKVLEGPYKGEIGYMYPSSTSFSKYTDYDNTRIKVEDALDVDVEDAPFDIPPPPSYTGNFLDRLKTEKTGATGIVTFDGGTLKITSFDDSKTHLVYGAKIELLSRDMVKEDGGWNLYHIKVKVTDDLADGRHNGKVGYMYPASTSFVSFANYSDEKMEAPKGFLPDLKKDKDNGNDYDALNAPDPTPADGSYELPSFTNEKTGITGTINSGLGDAYAYADGSDWSKEVYLKTGTKFELLSKKVFKDAITKYFFIKIKVTSDPGKNFTGKIMWVNLDETSISDRANKTDLTIK
jgi:hypothetical protein